MKFTVDTHLFRELGQFLVGRDSTALAELVKNSYDADATEVVVHGELLSHPDRGYIEIQDNGEGMLPAEFEQGFLRIASRIKETGSRYSSKYHRRYTGAKGIGRLAAHKLARHLSIDSIPSRRKSSNVRTQIHAEIDWDLIEQCKSLDDIDDKAMSITETPVSDTAKAGTVIRLAHPRRAWSESQRASFVSEVRGYQPPGILLQDIQDSIAPFNSLFDELIARDQDGADPGFSIRLVGDFEQGDERWLTVLSAIDWVLEIRAEEDGKIHYCITPTGKKRSKIETAKQHSFAIPHPAPETGPFYKARILLREGASSLKRSEESEGLYNGIRLYMEGFRVLPYGEPRNDWLRISADYNDRGDRIKALEESAFADLLDTTEGLKTIEEGHSVLSGKHYLGGIFLTQEGASSLRMVVNREGFEPNAEFETLVETIRTGIGLLTRVRAYHSAPSREVRRMSRAGTKRQIYPERHTTLSERTSQAVRQTQEDATTAAELAKKGQTASATKVLVESAKRLENLAVTAAESLRDQTGMIRVAASVGLQMGGFVHEIRAARGESKLLLTELSEFRSTEGLGSTHRRTAARLVRIAESLSRTIDWLARSLDEVSTIDKRRRRSRQNLRDSFDETMAFVAVAAEKREVHVDNEIDENLQTGPMFRSELFSILLNVLSNAVKFAAKNGRVRASATQLANGHICLSVENTGVAVDLSEAERLFRPFESSSSVADPLLGQGMGLGLPITRELIEEYGGSISFIAPSKGFVTAIQLIFPK